MTAVFVYGTLRHVPLLETVLGHGADGLGLGAARLPGWRVCTARGQAFPMIFAADDSAADGILVQGLGEDDLARLDFYERVFGYTLRNCTVDTAAGPVAAQFWYPPPNAYEPGDPFVLAQWAEKWGRINRRAAEEVMGYFGERSPGDLGPIYPMIHARAATWVHARDERTAPPPSGLDENDVLSDAPRRPYARFFAVEERSLRFRRFDGGMSDEVLRAAFVSTDAALVLPYDPVRDRVLLLEQFRMGPLARGDRSPWQLEPVAGRVDAGETPEDCARREAQEEAGLALRDLRLIHRGYPSPGCMSEYYHVYLGLADLPDRAAGLGGVDTEDEDIRSHVMSFEAAMALLDEGGIRVTPTALALNWLARNRDRLRADA